MAETVSTVTLSNWRQLLCRGQESAVDRFLRQVDASLPSRWTRDEQYEQTRARPDRIRCYLFDETGDAAIRVWLQRVTATRVRAGAIQLIRHAPQGDPQRFEALVTDFGNRCLLSAATRTGLISSWPKFGPCSAVTITAEMSLTRFADSVDGVWPLFGRNEESWDELVLTCLAEHVGIDRADLLQWFRDSGWADDIVPRIVDRFFEDASRRAKQLDALTSP